jgi:glycosyltransferase involved in cell wall biosynthesis
MIVVHANHLAAAGHWVQIVAAVIDTVFYVDPRVQLIQLPSKSKIVTLLRALFTKFNADIVVADIIPVACLVAVRNRSKTVYFAQDYDESYYTSRGMRTFIYLLYYFGLNLLKIKTIAVAQHLADRFYRQFGSKSYVVENGVDSAVFFPRPDYKLLSVKGTRKAFLVLSRNDFRKGFDIAVKVIQELPVEIASAIEVWIVGDTCKDVGGIVCRHFGYVCEVRLSQLMSSADIFLYPSRHEGLPLMPLETMACGCPVVTTTAVPYAVHEVNAMVAPIENTLLLYDFTLTVLQDKMLRDRLINEGLELANRYTIDEATQKFEKTLFKLVTLERPSI